jgi:hypothetical protein
LQAHWIRGAIDLSAAHAAPGGGMAGLISPAEKPMLHYSCDICKRPIDTHADVHHVVKIEVFPAVDDVADHGCCEDNGPHIASREDADHLEEMQDMLERLDEEDLPAGLADGARSMRFDLCDACRQRFVKNPLGVKSGKTLDFSNN